MIKQETPPMASVGHVRIALTRHTALLLSVASWTAALAITVIVVGLWFMLAADSARSAVPLAGVLALTAIVGISWQQFQARDRRRLLAAHDAYAEREIARSFRRRQKHRTAASVAKTLPGSQLSTGTRTDEDYVAQAS
jgi:hypothetical protein